MKVSIIIPFFNAEKTLEKAVKSILNQSVSCDLELILVNNNSTDQSRELAEELANQSKQIQLLDEHQQGVVFAFNKGLSVAKGEYIARMDADDEALPSRLSSQIKLLDKNSSIDAVTGKVIYEGTEINSDGFEHFVNWANQLQNHDDIWRNRFVELPVINPSLMARRTVFEQYGSYRDGDFPEDYDLILRWLSNGVVFGKVEDDVLVWKDSKGRLTRTDERYEVDAFYKLKTKYLADWLKWNSDFYPKVWIWGAGKRSRQRAEFLLSHGIEIEGYIDIKKDKLGSECLFYKDLQKENFKGFILSYVSNRGMGEEVRKFLLSRGFSEEEDFLLMS
ncbi:glycosyltransferase family 2 protein [Sediminitomix flava]|uniref:Glycosyltransferase involved in cell wall biosynthesis n=1 Tax=Sediminitomix flava TaxID=379075 RepID=A0A315ZGP6_SEDFL|nr:glycosyltransferase [Sediminitomix flava]PWJ44300.1 glycosyltransferase involved in cell wall biosynthesis [Sediminitomix flava]